MVPKCHVARRAAVARTPARQGARQGSLLLSNRRAVARSAATAQEQAQRAFPGWANIWRYLREQKLESISPAQVQERLKSGNWVLVDVRMAPEFEKCSAQGAISAPLFQEMDMTDATPARWLRAAAYMFNGIKPVEYNPAFVDAVKNQANGKGVIMMCETGGTLTPSANFMNGKASRSLKAAFKVLSEGASAQVAHLEGGLYGWFLMKEPMTAEYDTTGVGRTPNIAAEPTIPEDAGKGGDGEKKKWFL